MKAVALQLAQGKGIEKQILAWLGMTDFPKGPPTPGVFCKSGR
jgi:hypothetical protein